MKIAKLCATNVGEREFKDITGVVTESTIEYHFKSASLTLAVHDVQYRLWNSKSGVPRIDVGERVILYIENTESNDIVAIQILTDDVVVPTVKSRFIFGSYLKSCNIIIMLQDFFNCFC